jgi:toxin ParE1/3/4
MIEVLIRPEAESDIEGIADETIERWGRKQARTYVATLRADIASLADFPNRFPIHEQTALGLRRMRSGHHLVFYLIGEDAVEVVRVFHERRDPTLELF